MLVEKVILDYLTEQLAASQRYDVGVYMEMPEQPLPSNFIVIEKTGSARINRVCTDNIALQSCATSLLGAAQLNQLTKTLMDGIISLPAIGAAHLDTDYNFTDPETKVYRYQAIFRISYILEE